VHRFLIVNIIAINIQTELFVRVSVYTHRLHVSPDNVFFKQAYTKPDWLLNLGIVSTVHFHLGEWLLSSRL